MIRKIIYMNSKNSIKEKSKEIAKLIRIHALGTSVTAVVGALSVKGINLEITHFILLFLIGILVNTLGFVHNDLKDIEVDKLSKELTERPLVKGTITIRSAWIIVILSLIMIFMITLIFFQGILPISILSISVIFGLLYNLYSKKILGADVFLSVAMALFCLFGALAVSNITQGLQDIGILTWIIVVIVFIHVFVMNVMEGGLKDAKNDGKAGAKTFAIFLGVKTDKKMYVPLSFKAINISFKILTVILVSIPFLFLNLKFSLWQITFLTLFIIGMLFSTIKLLNMKSFDRKKIGFHVRNHELTSYGLVPIMLMGFIGIPWLLFLVIFPFLWFISFNYVLYRKVLTNPKTF